MKLDTVLVTGSAGFVGTHVVKELEKRGYNVVTYDIYDNPEQDIRDQKMLDTYMSSVDYVCHLAANPYIPYGYMHPNEFFETNANGTQNVLNAARKQQTRVVYWSTSEVYGTAENPLMPMNEDHRIHPHSTYAVAKYAGDALCQTYYHEHGVDVTVLRQFNCYGPHETWRYIIPEIIMQLDNNCTVNLGNIYAERDFTYVEDAARAGVDVMESTRLSGEVVNSGSGETWSIKSIAYILADIMRPDEELVIKVDKSRMRPYDVDRLLCDNSKLQFYTGWSPEIGFREGLERTVAFYRDNGSKWDFRVMK